MEITDLTTAPAPWIRISIEAQRWALENSQASLSAAQHQRLQVGVKIPENVGLFAVQNTDLHENSKLKTNLSAWGAENYRNFLTVSALPHFCIL